MVFTGRLDSLAMSHMRVLHLEERDLRSGMQFVEVWMEHRLRHFGPRVVAVKNLGIHCQRQIKRKPVAGGMYENKPSSCAWVL